MVRPIDVHQLLAADRHHRFCQLEDELVATLVCTPDGKPLNGAMVVALDWVQDRRSCSEAQLEGYRGAQAESLEARREP
jgi:hypothetical protein